MNVFMDAPDEIPWSSWRDQVARVSWEVRIVMSFLVVFSGVWLLVSAWMLAHADADARKHFPLQFADELSSRFYLQYVLFNRSIPLEIRRRVGVSSALAMVAFAGFAAVAYLADNPVIAVLLLLICGFGSRTSFCSGVARVGSGSANRIGSVEEGCAGCGTV